MLLVESPDIPNTNRYFFEEDYFPDLAVNELSLDLKAYRRHNHQVLAEVAQIDGVRSFFLKTDSKSTALKLGMCKLLIRCTQKKGDF